MTDKITSCVIGLVSHNAAETIASVGTAVQEGLRQLGAERCGILWADTGSTDDTVARGRTAMADCDLREIASAPTTPDLLEIPYHGIPGKARALRAILTAARELQADACVVLDAGIRTVEPRWVERLVRPIVSHGFDFVLSYYHRSPHEGALTKGLVYPLTRALYGFRFRQPAAAEFACSARLLAHVLEEDFWDREGAQVGVDLWLTTCLAGGDFRMGEAALGVRKHGGRGEAALDLGTTLSQVVGSLFADLEDRARQWQRIRGSVPVQHFGDVPLPTPAAESPVDVASLVDTYRLGTRELRDIWTWVLPPHTIIDLGKLVHVGPAEFLFPDDLWARIVYDFAIAYRLRVLARDHLLRSLTPLYLGWLASFVRQVRGRSPADVDDRVERLAETFEAQKAYLIAKWRWPERLRA